MNDLVLLVSFLALVVLLAVVVTYNKLVVRRQRISESWANVDTELRRRHELIPNLVATVKGYAMHERETFERITQLRAEADAEPDDTPERMRAEQALAREMAHALAVAEAYPDLKASANFLQLQRALVETEDRIQAARRFYNANVRDHNNAVESFPSNLVARRFGFGTHAYFELQGVAERGAPDVTL